MLFLSDVSMLYYPMLANLSQVNLGTEQVRPVFAIQLTVM